MERVLFEAAGAGKMDVAKNFRAQFGYEPAGRFALKRPSRFSPYPGPDQKS